MFRKPLLALLSTIALAQGCIIIDGDPPPDPPPPGPASGDITFEWRFAELTCAEVPEVANVRVTIHGETLENGGLYPCSQLGFDGITLQDFVGGTYAYTVEAFDNSMALLFATDGSFTVDGDIDVAVNLEPQGDNYTYSYVTWTFPENSAAANPTCAEAGVTHMEITFSNDATVRVDCELGRSGQGWRTPFVAPGAHAIFLRAVNADSSPERAYYFKISTVQTSTVGAQVNDYDLEWYGGEMLTWEIYDAGDPAVKLTCAQAGIEWVYINFQHPVHGWAWIDADGNPTPGDKQPCSENGTYAVRHYNELIPGDNVVYIQGVGSGDQNYSNGSFTPEERTITITAGVFTEDLPEGTEPLKMFMYPDVP